MAPREICALLAALFAFVGLPHISGYPSIPRNLVCFRPCCQASCYINCSWEMPAGTTETTSILNIWYQAEKRQTFEAGHANSVLFSKDEVYSWENATAWVESWTQDGRLFRSENQTFFFSQAIKFQRLSAASFTVSRSKGLITLAWPESHECYSLPREKEARMKPPTVPNWARGNCTPGKDDGAKGRAAVVCQVRENVPYEVQVRYRFSHWSSYWSDWSPSVVVPVEIFRSPEINFTVGRLGGDGLRNVTLEWEGPSPDQGMVDYILVFDLLPCRKCPSEMEALLKTIYNQTSYQVALSGAAYNISLQAANKAGKAPVSFVQLPPEQEAGPRILNVSLSGQNFKAWWKAPVDAGMFCFESQALGEFPLETRCNDTRLKASKIYENSGVVKPNQCYRLAIHGLSQTTYVWSTFGFTHLFQRNASLEDPINVSVTKRTPNSAMVQWEPPGALSSCPGVLKKFILCCRKDEESVQTMYYDANASEREFTIPDLQPQTAYLVGVWASTDGSGKDCKAHLLFLTGPPDAKLTALTGSFLTLGIFVTFLTAAGGFHFCRKRIQEALWPLLPDPDGTEAVKILSTDTPNQVHGWRHFMEPLESQSTVEPFLVEKGEASHAMKDTEDSQGLVPAVEELKYPIQEALSSGDPLLSEYKAQGLLNPVEDEPQVREGGKELLPSQEACKCHHS